MGTHETDRRSTADEDIEALVSRLDNLYSYLHVQVDIFRLGERAVPALVRFLLEPPSQFPQGRVLAAEVLGRIKGERAFQGLLSALDPQRFRGLDPVLRLSEEDVQNAVAQQLARIRDRRAISVLLDALRTHHLVGAAEALVEFGETSALPWLVEGLEDAFKRDRFSKAIFTMGRTAIPSLIATLEQRRMYYEQELLPSVERRAEALRLLGLLSASQAVDVIRTALGDPHYKVRTEAALALAAVGDQNVALEAVPALLAGLVNPDFVERDRCTDALVRIGQACSRFIGEALLLGCLTIGSETVPLTIKARAAAFAVLNRLNGDM
jgi:HEAT repeat protein